MYQYSNRTSTRMEIKLMNVITKPTREELIAWREAEKLADRLLEIAEEIESKISAINDRITRDVPVWAEEMDLVAMTDEEIDEFVAEGQ